MRDRVVATYLIETPYPLEQAAESLAGEQSTGTFIQIPGETDELKERFRARVESIQTLESVKEPSLPGARLPDPTRPLFHRGIVSISFPIDNMGVNLPALISTLMGNLSELREVSGLRLLDVELPKAFGDAYPGPRFGVQGTRELAGVFDRPIVGTIVKPSVGLSPDQTADLVRELVDAGVDFIKDDELLADPPHSPIAERVAKVMRVINEAADRTGKKVMFAFNITDEPDRMLRHHDAVVKAGGTCVMVSLNSVGYGGLSHLRRRSQVPIHGHRNGWGMLTRFPYLGLDFTAYQKFWRLLGVDQLHVNGLQNKFSESDDSVVRSIKACLAPMFGDDPVMPVVSSGQWGGQAPETYRRTQTVDLMYLAGGGIVAHPGGAKAGVRAIQQAWEAAVQGIPLDEHANDHAELRQAIETFGP